MIYALLIATISLLVSFKVTNNIFSPSIIVSGLWLFCILAFNFYPNNLTPLKDQFYVGISLWVGVFTFFSLFTQSLKYSYKGDLFPNINARKLYFIISILSFPFVLFSIYSLISGLGITTNIFYYLRLSAIGKLKGLDEGTSNNYFATLWLVTYALELYHFEKKRLPHLIIIFLINFAWSFLVMSKIVFLFLFITTLFILFYKKIIKTKTIVISLIAIFSFFLIIQTIRTPNAKKTEDLKYDFFTQYVLTGMPAFEQIKPNSSKTFGEKTFRFFHAVTYKLGLDKTKPSDNILDFTQVNNKGTTYYTNVYTVMYPYYKDFGYWGVSAFALILGSFFGYIYKKANKRSSPFVLIYSILLGGLITQFMNENTITTLSFTIQIIILCFLPYWANYIVLKINDKISND